MDSYMGTGGLWGYVGSERLRINLLAVSRNEGMDPCSE